MVKRGLLIFCIIYLTGSVVTLRQRILNGQNAYIEDFPHQASLRYNNSHFCGGSIVSAKHIVTAAHCLLHDDIRSYELVTVVTGTSFLDRHGNFHKVASVTVHPHYWHDGNRGLHDIAIITLQDVIVFDKVQQKIRLPKNNFNVGDRANLTGWGLTQQFPSEINPNQLQRMETKLTSREECQRKVFNPKKTKIYDSEVCTIRSNKLRICYGDSGGPLAVNGELVGLVAWFDGNTCGGLSPDVYTNVYKYKDFVESIIY